MRPSLIALLGSFAVGNAMALPVSEVVTPRSFVPGKTFDRFVQIWLENQDFLLAILNSDLIHLATKGRLLTNYKAITHPSQPNYVAAIGGSTNGVNSNDEYNLDPSIKTVVDLLEAGGISWATYQEDLPYSGFTGSSHEQYRRKHNPVMCYQSITGNPSRLEKSKNFTMFFDDLNNDVLPQWIFITPDMNNDGHDTGLSYGAKWARNWITPLLDNPKFNNDRTLIILTYDEGVLGNTVYAVLLGGALSSKQIPSVDNTKYNHYSLIKTVEENWGLGNLGKGDVSAKAFF